MPHKADPLVIMGKWRSEQPHSHDHDRGEGAGGNAVVVIMGLWPLGDVTPGPKAWPTVTCLSWCDQPRRKNVVMGPITTYGGGAGVPAGASGPGVTVARRSAGENPMISGVPPVGHGAPDPKPAPRHRQP